MAFRSNASGRWQLLGLDDEGNVVRALIRPIPPSENNAILRANQWRPDCSQEIRHKTLIDRAVFALVDFENFVLVPETEAEAEKLSKAFGEDVKKDQDVCFDGRLTDRVRRCLLEAFQIRPKIKNEDPNTKDQTPYIEVDLAWWVTGRAEDLGKVALATDADLAKT